MKDLEGRVTIDGFYDNIISPNEEDIELMRKLVEAGEEERLRKQFEVERFRKDLHGLELFKEYLFPADVDYKRAEQRICRPSSHDHKPRMG